MTRQNDIEMKLHTQIHRTEKLQNGGKEYISKI